LKFRKELELQRRRNKENLPLHSLEKSKSNFEELMKKIRTYEKVIQKRLRMINKHWLNLTLFHYLPGAPATNNPIESYYSKSLKTDSKKQFRTDYGIENQIKLTNILLSAGRHKNPFNFSIDIVFFRTFEIPFKSKITKC